MMEKIIIFVRTTEIYNDSRASKEIKALSKAGFNIVVLGWNRNGKAVEECKKAFNGYDNVSFRFYDCRLSNGIGIKNINKLIKWGKWVKRQIKAIDNVDFVHACDLDSGFCVLKYCRKKGIKLVYDIFDYYIDSHGIPKVVRKYVENLEIGYNKTLASLI